MTARRSKSETEIPLFLIPHVIARQIREQGDDVFRISVKRTHWHHYTVTVRTKQVHRELRVRKDSSPARHKPDSPENTPGDESSGGAA
jgi:hypothetical protein